MILAKYDDFWNNSFPKIYLIVIVIFLILIFLSSHKEKKVRAVYQSLGDKVVKLKMGMNKQDIISIMGQYPDYDEGDKLKFVDFPKNAKIKRKEKVSTYVIYLDEFGKYTYFRKE